MTHFSCKFTLSLAIFQIMIESWNSKFISNKRFPWKCAIDRNGLGIYHIFGNNNDQYDAQTMKVVPFENCL